MQTSRDFQGNYINWIQPTQSTPFSLWNAAGAPLPRVPKEALNEKSMELQPVKAPRKMLGKVGKARFSLSTLYMYRAQATKRSPVTWQHNIRCISSLSYQNITNECIAKQQEGVMTKGDDQCEEIAVPWHKYSTHIGNSKCKGCLTNFCCKLLSPI